MAEETIKYKLTGDNDELIKALDEVEKAFFDVDKAAKKTDKSTDGVGKTSKKTGKAATEASQGFGKLQDKLIGSNSSISEMTALLGPASTGIGAIAAAAVAAATAMFKLAQANSEFVDQISNLAVQTGLSNDTILALDLAAGRAGASVQELQGGLKALVTRFSDAAKNGGEAEASLTGIGISLAEIEAGSKDSEQALRLTLDAIANLPTEAERAAAASKIFGEEGSKLAVVLREGSAGLDEMSERAKELGLVITDDAAAASAEMDRALTDLNAALTGLVSTLGTAATDSFIVLIDALAETISFLNGVAQALDRVGGLFADLGVVVDAYNVAMESLGLATEDAADKTEQLNSALDRNSKAFTDAEKFVRDYEQSLKTADEAATDRAATIRAALEEEVKQLRRNVKEFEEGTEERTTAFQKFFAKLQEFQRFEDAALADSKRRADERAKKEEDARAREAQAAERAAQAQIREAKRVAAEEAKNLKAAESAIQDFFKSRERAQQELAAQEEAFNEGRKQTVIDILDFRRQQEEAADKLNEEIHQKQLARLDELARLQEENLRTLFSMVQTISQGVLDLFTQLTDASNARLEQDLQNQQDLIMANEDRIDRARRAEEDFQRAVQAGDQETADAINATGDRLSQAELQRLEENLARQKEKEEEITQAKIKGEREAFLLEKAAALASIAIQTARAIVEAAPNPIAMTAAGIAGGIQGAVVAAQQFPEFHDGGLIEATAPNRPAAPDEVDIRARGGEFMINAQATAANRPLLEAMNRGENMGMGNVTVIIDGEAVESSLVRMAQGDGDVADLFRDPSPKGRNIWR